MNLASAPLQIQLPFGNGDVTKTSPVPVPSQIGITPGKASFTDGFVPLNGTPISSGGIPPFKADMNGLLFMLSDIDLWMSAGAGFQWNSGYSAAIGGYPKGARVLNAAGNGYWLSTADNNTTNPDTGGAGWVATWRATSSVYASAPQTVNAGINKVVFDTVEFDSFSQWDATDHRFVANWKGNFRVSGVVQMPAAPAQDIVVLIRKNGSSVRVGCEIPQLSNVDLTFPFSSIIPMNAGDYAEIFLQVASNTTVGVAPLENGVVMQFEFLGT